MTIETSQAEMQREKAIGKIDRKTGRKKERQTERTQGKREKERKKKQRKKQRNRQRKTISKIHGANASDVIRISKREGIEWNRRNISNKIAKYFSKLMTYTKQ